MYCKIPTCIFYRTLWILKYANDRYSYPLIDK